MSDFNINDYLLEQEAIGIARDALNECDPDDDEALDEYIFQTCDGHEWVIYNYKSLKLCCECNTDDGEQWLEDIGLEPTTNIFELANKIAFATLYQKSLNALAEIKEEVA